MTNIFSRTEITSLENTFLKIPTLCGSYALIKPNGQALVRNGEYRPDWLVSLLQPENWNINFSPEKYSSLLLLQLHFFCKKFAEIFHGIPHFFILCSADKKYHSWSPGFDERTFSYHPVAYLWSTDRSLKFLFAAASHMESIMALASWFSTPPSSALQ